MFANLFAGMFIRFRKNIRVGEYVKIKDKDKNVQGHIISLNMLNIRLETGKEELVFIPNMAVFHSQIVKIKPEMRKHRK